MTQPATNAQVALQCAMQYFAKSVSVYVGDITEVAESFLRWLNATTPPVPDQPGELG